MDEKKKISEATKTSTVSCSLQRRIQTNKNTNGTAWWLFNFYSRLENATPLASCFKHETNTSRPGFRSCVPFDTTSEHVTTRASWAHNAASIRLRSSWLASFTLVSSHPTTSSPPDFDHHQRVFDTNQFSIYEATAAVTAVSRNFIFPFWNLPLDEDEGGGEGGRNTSIVLLRFRIILP